MVGGEFFFSCERVCVWGGSKDSRVCVRDLLNFVELIVMQISSRDKVRSAQVISGVEGCGDGERTLAQSIRDLVDGPVSSPLGMS